MAKKVFISYRQSDPSAQAGALGRELRRRFGTEQVFRDRENLEGGENWRTTVLNAIDSEAVLLVLIGENWLTPEPGQARSRLHDPEDPVRMEIVDGFKDKAKVIPVLLDDARMPAEEDLPPDLRLLRDITALRLRDDDWEHHVERICATLERAGLVPVQIRSVIPGKPRTGAKPQLSWKTVLAVLFTGLNVLVLLVSEPFDADDQTAVVVFGITAVGFVLAAVGDIRQGLNRGNLLNIGAGAIALLTIPVAFMKGAVAAPSDVVAPGPSTVAPPDGRTASATNQPVVNNQPAAEQAAATDVTWVNTHQFIGADEDAPRACQPSCASFEGGWTTEWRQWGDPGSEELECKCRGARKQP